MSEIVTIHCSPLVEELYVFSGTSCFTQRSEPTCVMDATYTYEGEKVYISGLRGKFNRRVWREVTRIMAKKGCLVLEYEHGGQQYEVDLLDMTTRRVND